MARERRARNDSRSGSKQWLPQTIINRRNGSVVPCRDPYPLFSNLHQYNYNIEARPRASGPCS